MSVFHHGDHPHDHDEACCLTGGPFDRLTYVYGQVLTPQHLRRAQESIYEKMKLHARCFAGWGVACGLAVSAVPNPKDPCEDESEPDDHSWLHAADEPPPPAREVPPPAPAPPPPHPAPPPPVVEPHAHCRTRIAIDCGFAVDCEGNDLVVRQPLVVDLYSMLSPDDRRQVDDGQTHTLYVSLCYHRFGFEPIRTVMHDGCETSCDGAFAFQREGVCVQVTLDPPATDTRCDSCCDCCEDKCVLLARISGFVRGRRVGQVDNSVRRMLSRYQPTVVTGVSWWHGGTYAPDDIDTLLYEKGLTVTLSRKVQADTLIPGVFDVYVYELGGGRSGTVRILKGELDPRPTGAVDQFTYRLTDRERIDPGDRLMFVFRGDHVLDECCQPVDANHVGGLIPVIPGSQPRPTERREPPACTRDPRRFGHWTSGNGTPGGTLESWIHAAGERSKPRGSKKP
jgi:hypothetical protein